MLAKFTFADGSVYRVCTEGLNTAQGGTQYGGVDWDGRIKGQRLNPIQGMSEQGIDILPQVSLSLADPDKYIYLNYEAASGKGFRGATLELTFIFRDVATGTFSSDSLTPFLGTCGKPSCNETSLEVTAVSKFNLQRRFLPPVPIQRRCPWIFPTTAAQRQAGADNSDSIYFKCGYSPDASGANARGNYASGVTPFTSCDYTVANCQARGMYKIDASSRLTARFGGVSWDTGPGGKSREFTSGQWIEVTNNPNAAKYGEYFPLGYGTVPIDAVCVNIVGDGNSTRGEAVVCLGSIGQIVRVVVNDRLLPPANDITLATNFKVADALFRYSVVTRGNRQGGANLDVPYNGNGDPYGSLGTIMWVVPRAVQENSSTPRLQVLAQVGKVRVYTNTSTYTEEYSSNPIWVMMDVLVWSGLDYVDFDLQTWIDAATYAAVNINFTDQFGATVAHARYSCSLVLRQRRSAADVIRGLRQGCNAMLSFNLATGKIQVTIKQTLADQQPSAPDGTNYATAISSKNHAGTTANGYVAYDFGPGSISRDKEGRSTFEIVPRDNNDSPNVVSMQFINQDNDYSGDSLRFYQQADYDRMVGQETAEVLRSDGLNTLDQAKRISRCFLAEGLEGNPIGDTRGTDYYRFETTFKAVKLRVGQICRLTEPQHQISNVLVRILSITPMANWERCTLLVARHNDNWYLDTFGQVADPALNLNGKPREDRPPYAWEPGAGGPVLWGSVQFQSQVVDTTFQVKEQHATAADGSAIIRLQIHGQNPINVFGTLPSPHVAQQGTTASSGGSVAGLHSIYAAVCAIGSDGLYSNPSRLCKIEITNAGTANTFTVPVLSWPSGTSGYALFASYNPAKLAHQVTVMSSTPSSITRTSLAYGFYGIPDAQYDRVRVKVKRVLWAGVALTTVAAKGSFTITLTSAAFATNAFAGYDISLLSAHNLAGYTAPLTWGILSNTSNVMTVSWDPTSAAICVGDWVVVRSTPTAGSDGSGNYIIDANWANNLMLLGTGFTVDELRGMILRSIGYTGIGEIYKISSNTATKIYIEGEWITTPDSLSRFVIEEPMWQVIADSESQSNENPGDGSGPGGPSSAVDVKVEVTNYNGQVVGIQAVLFDGDGNESIAAQSPYRDIYILGSAGDIGTDLGYNQQGGATTITIELSDGFTQELLLDRAITAIDFPTLNASAPPPGISFKVKLLQDSTGGRAVTWHADYVDVARYELGPDPDTFSAFTFVIRPDGKAELTSLPVLGSANS